MKMKKGGGSYGLRKSITLFLSRFIIVPMFFDSVYSKVVTLLVIYKVFLKFNILYMASLRLV